MTGSRSPIDFSASFRLASSLVFGLTLLIVVAFDQAFFGLRIHGRRNLRLPRALLVSNHSMTLDPGIIAHALRPRRTLFSAMQRTFAIPVLGTYIRLLGAFPVPTEHPIERLRSPIECAAARHGFVHFFPGFINTRHIVKGYLALFDTGKVRPALAESEDTTGSARRSHLAEKEIP